MKAVLEILKRYVFEIGCGLGAALGIALILMQLGSMGDVIEQMEKAQQLKGQLETAARGSNIINEKAVAKAQERIDKIRAGYDEVWTFAKKLNAHDPLTKDVFPDSRIADDGIAFQKAYMNEVGSWIDIMHAGDIPSDLDIRAEEDLMNSEQPVDVSLGTGKSGTGSDEESGKAKNTDPFQSAEIRAAIRRARSIQCYATQDSFQVSAVSKRTGPMWADRPPTSVEMWHAQLEVWVQRDLVDAIASVNNAAAQRIKAEAAQISDERERAKFKPWVGNLPIKELVSIQTTTYYVTESGTGAGTGSAGSRDRPYPPGNADTVFTGNSSNDLYELMQFTIKLVVDARDIPEILAGLSRDGFRTPLRIAYEEVPPNLTMQGRIYGDGPVVAIVVDFETVFFSELYLSLMPDEILEKLGKQRPEPKQSEGT